MRTARYLLVAAVAGCFSLQTNLEAKAAEYALSSYVLGQNAFGAGITPPAGTYVSVVPYIYSANIGGGGVDFGGVTLRAGAHIDFLVSAINGLYVFDHKVLGGNLAASVTIPVAYMNLGAQLAAGPISAERTIEGGGLGDIVSKLQLGWKTGDFAHTMYVLNVAPTGRYETGFNPITGLHRPGIDTGWAFTWTDKARQLQFNGTVGVMFNFENTETDYKTGDEFHFEWAVGREISPGVVFGLVGYDYRQFTNDSGSGAHLGPFKGRVDAIGLGISGTTLVGKTPVIFNLRTYREFDAENHFEGNSSTASVTVRF